MVTSKYPAWMVAHPRHVVYMQHKLRGLYDTYHFIGLPERHPTTPAPVARAADVHGRQRRARATALPEFFARMDGAARRPASPDDLFAFPGPFIRELVHWLDGVGLAPAAIRRYGAISATVRERADYFPPGVEVFVAHPPTGLPRACGKARAATCSPPAGSTTPSAST